MRHTYKRKIICSCGNDLYYKIYKDKIWYWECYNCMKRKLVKMTLKELRTKYTIGFRIKSLIEDIEGIAFENEGFNPREIAEIEKILRENRTDKWCKKQEKISSEY